MIKEKLSKAWQWIKRKGVWFLGIIGIGTVLAISQLPADVSFENLPNVAREQGLYRVSFDKWSEVEIPEIDIPTAKLKKWKDETFIKISYPDFDKKVKPKQENKKLKWKGKDMEVHLYPLEPREFEENGHTVKQLEQGGFEFEIILKEKPATNKIVLDIETKGLKFYYQPELTEKEKESARRPENVVGSYVFYHKTQDKILKTKEETDKYKVGIFGVLYRPKIIDSNGWEVWGEQNIEINENGIGIQTITIPQDFIDNAVYPIKQVAGDNFGYETAGSSSAYGPNDIYGSYFTGAAGEGTSMTWYNTYVFSGNAVKMALYTRTNGTGSYLTNGTTDTVTSGFLNTWTSANFTSNPTISAVSYWLLWWSNHGNPEIAYNSNSGTGGTQVTTYNSWPATVSLTSQDRIYSIYCTYSAAAAERRIIITE